MRAQCPDQRRAVVYRLDDLEPVGVEDPDQPIAQQARSSALTIRMAGTSSRR